MGKVIVPAKVENMYDLNDVERGILSVDGVRSVEVQNALVDTGAMYLSLPVQLVNRLGLKPYRARQVRTSGGLVTLSVYGPVKLTVQGRDCCCDLMGIPDDCPALIGQVPLELLDFVVDPTHQRLIGNPEHGGEHMIDMF